MAKKITIFFILCFLFSLSLWLFFYKKPSPAPVQIELKLVEFADLPAWQKTSLKQSFEIFQRSCRVFLKQNPNQVMQTPLVVMHIKDWVPACQVAVRMTEVTENTARSYFETWFNPVALIEKESKKPKSGIFTGYYLAEIEGNSEKTAEYPIPLYGLPSDLVVIHLKNFDSKLKGQWVGRVQDHKLLPYYTRKEIDAGAIKDKASIIAWVKSPLERLTLEIEGSGFIKLKDKQTMAVGYHGQNGRPYQSIAGILIDRGILTRDNASTNKIRDYFDTHPDKVNEVFHQNQSFVFFRVKSEQAGVGAQGLPLTPGYSLAVDLNWIPLGVPIWLDTERPDETEATYHPLQRLMLAQDTGGAIRGPVRADVYWGAGEKASKIAMRMKNKGYYWLLLPREIVIFQSSKKSKT